MSLVQEIVRAVNSDSTLELVKPLEVGREGWTNELLLFIKPEIFLVGEEEKVSTTVSLFLSKLEEFGAEVSGVLVVSGSLLEEEKIMDRHYGFINELSRNASKVIDEKEKSLIADCLGIDSSQFVILGGHEYLEKYPSENCFELDQLWFSKKSVKIKSGFYVQSYEKGEGQVVLVNGFHPAQLQHFTEKSRKIALFLIHSNTNWDTLREEMIGDTFPEKAGAASIRGELYKNPEKYGLEEVSIANNGVHLSAGAFEGVFEISNFFGKLLKFDISKDHPLLVKRLISSGVDIEDALAALDNPMVTSSEDLNSATEHKNTDEAVNIYTSYLKES